MSKDAKFVNFSNKYFCDSVMGVYNYGRDNLTIINAIISEYSSLNEEEQDLKLLEKFGYIKEILKITGDKLLCGIKDNSIHLHLYEYLLRTPTYKQRTLETLVKYKIVQMINKNNWNFSDVKEIFIHRSNEVKEIIDLFTGNDKDMSSKIYKRLYEDKTSCVKFIQEYLDSDKEYDCRVFFNDKPIYIYQSEIDKINEINKKYKNDTKDQRRIVKLACLLLAWQKADQNQYYNRREYAIFEPGILSYNPICGAGASDAMIADYKKLIDDGYMKRILPQVAAPRQDAPYMYYKMSFCVANKENQKVALEITDFEYIWEQIMICAFGSIEVLETPKEKDILQGVVKAYNSKTKSGKVYIADKNKDYSFSGCGKLSDGMEVNAFVIGGKKPTAKILRKKSEKVNITYAAIKRCGKCGKMFYAKQMGNGSGNCNKCNKH